MKKIITILLITAFATSFCSVESKEEGMTEAVIVEPLRQEIQLLKDSLKMYRDSIPFDVYMNARKIEKIKHYIKITEKNDDNRKFFYGWVKRTMSE